MSLSNLARAVREMTKNAAAGGVEAPAPGTAPGCRVVVTDAGGCLPHHRALAASLGVASEWAEGARAQSGSVGTLITSGDDGDGGRLCHAVRMDGSAEVVLVDAGSVAAAPEQQPRPLHRRESQAALSSRRLGSARSVASPTSTDASRSSSPKTGRAASAWRRLRLQVSPRQPRKIDEVIDAVQKVVQAEVEEKQRHAVLREAQKKASEREQSDRYYGGRLQEVRGRVAALEAERAEANARYLRLRSEGKWAEATKAVAEKARFLKEEEKVRGEASWLEEQWAAAKERTTMTDEERAQYRAVLAARAFHRESLPGAAGEARERGAKALQGERAVRGTARGRFESALAEAVRRKIEGAKAKQEASRAREEEARAALQAAVAELAADTTDDEAHLSQKQRKQAKHHKLSLQRRVDRLKAEVDGIVREREAEPTLDEQERRALRGLQAVQRLRTKREEEERARAEDDARKRRARLGGRLAAKGFTAAELRLARDKEEFQRQAAVLHARVERSAMAAERALQKELQRIVEAEMEARAGGQWSAVHDILEEKMQVVESLQEAVEEVEAAGKQKLADDALGELSQREREVLRIAAAATLQRLSVSAPAPPQPLLSPKLSPGSARLRSGSPRSPSGPATPSGSPQSLSVRPAALQESFSSDNSARPPLESPKKGRDLRRPSAQSRRSSVEPPPPQPQTGAESVMGGLIQHMRAAVGVVPQIRVAQEEEPQDVGLRALPEAVFVRWREALVAVSKGEEYVFDLDAELDEEEEMSQARSGSPSESGSHSPLRSRSSGTRRSGRLLRRAPPRARRMSPPSSKRFPMPEPSEDDEGSEAEELGHLLGTLARLSGSASRHSGLMEFVRSDEFGATMPQFESFTAAPVSVGSPVQRRKSAALRSRRMQWLQRHAPALVAKERRMRCKPLCPSVGAGPDRLLSMSIRSSTLRPSPTPRSPQPVTYTLLDRLELKPPADSSSGDEGEVAVVPEAADRRPLRPLSAQPRRTPPLADRKQRPLSATARKKPSNSARQPTRRARAALRPSSAGPRAPSAVHPTLR